MGNIQSGEVVISKMGSSTRWNPEAWSKTPAQPDEQSRQIRQGHAVFDGTVEDWQALASLTWRHHADAADYWHS